jgi:hypothetical protein
VNIPEIPFIEFPKIARFNRGVIVTEKIDGTNAQVYINDTGTEIYAGSRTRWITPSADNMGFAKWVEENRDELLKLGPGSHFGEWWGHGIQRGYDMKEKKFSLFNVHRWSDPVTRPPCCDVVPVLWEGLFSELDTEAIVKKLAENGSYASPGFMKPEGIVIYHTAGHALFKKTIDKDEQPKSKA